MTVFEDVTISHKSLKKWQTNLLLIFVLFGVVIVAGCTSSTSTPSAPNPQTSAPATSSETVSEANASRTAESYLNLAGFSRSGLIKQLMFEGYSESDAIYGADAQNSNWNEQAARTAKSYLDISGFSRSSLIKQLKFEGYSKQEAEYGASANGL